MSHRFLLCLGIFAVCFTATASLFSDSFEDWLDSPNLTIVDVDERSAFLQWEVVSNADSYSLYYASRSFKQTDMSNEAELMQFIQRNNGEVITTSDSNVKLTNLIYSTQYYVTAKAKNTQLSSPFSQEISFVTALSSPKSLVVTSEVIGQINATWQKIASASSYTIYLFEQKVTQADITKRTLPTLVQELSPQTLTTQAPFVTFTSLEPGKEFFILVTATVNGIESPPSEIKSAVSRSALNDTGVTLAEKVLESDTGVCQAKALGRQDCFYGKDSKHASHDDGFAGFSFTKLGVDGQILPVTNQEWQCVKDNNSGLIWEIKTAQSKDSLFYFYDAQYGGINDAQDNPTDGGSDGIWAGIPGTSSTAGYIETINQLALCGFDDWRLPTDKELRSLIHYGQNTPNISSEIVTIDANFFPNAAPNDYWTSIPVSANPTAQWTVYFGAGTDNSREKSSQRRVRLVRGNQ